ncbi:hypothetical protein PG985_000182 [Apiospora marii]|uniref:uncharacterized protein n=1 Tax=Apiospora marii TaxID=335849 RepID=UPI00312F7706
MNNQAAQSQGVGLLTGFTGAPPNFSTGNSPLGILLGSSNWEYPERSLVLQTDTERGPVSTTSLWAGVNAHKVIQLLDHIPSLPQRFECGPLSLAIISGDLKQVTDLLDRFPNTLNERNLLGHTPLHLAVNKPDCLSLLTKVTPRSSEILNLRDNNSRTPLDLAMSLSGGLCRSRNFYQKCRGCGCARSVSILLKAGCAVPQPAAGFLSSSILRTSSNRAVRRYARHMANRRSRLRQLGMNHSSILAFEGFVVDTAEMLDTRAEELSNILTKHNIRIASPLVLLRSELPNYNGSIYQSLRRPWQAEIFWHLMFRDLNSPSLKNKSPPLVTAFTGSVSSFDYIEWLLEHGADPFRPFQTNTICEGRSRAPDETERTCTHAMMFEIGDTIRCARWDKEKADIEYLKGLQALNNRFIHLGLTDACTCACSIKGCTLQVYQLKGLLDFQTGRMTPRATLADRLTDPAHFSSEVTQYYEQFAMTLSKSCHRDTIRFLTFSALGATHTCCLFTLRICRYKISPEDIQDVQDEEKAILERLEQLVLHFEAELFAILEKWPDHPNRLAEFWPNYWLPKMQQVLAEDEESRLSEESRQRAEEAGVVWNKSTSSSDSSLITVYDKRVWGHMSKVLDDIASGK